MNDPDDPAFSDQWGFDLASAVAGWNLYPGSYTATDGPFLAVVDTGVSAAHPDLARDFVAMATSPEVQAEGIVQRFNWYPGIDAQHVQAKLDKKVWDKLFVDITPADLKQNAMPFPISPYFTEILNEYERIAAK